MEKETEEYQKIYVENLLQQIRKRVEECLIFPLEEEKRKQVDQRMRVVLKEGYSESSEEKKQKFKDIMVLYYYALYNDNVNLLQNLLAENYNFENCGCKLNLDVLNKNITSLFLEKDYVHLVKKQDTVITNFLHSIKDLTPEEKEKLQEKFASILTINPEFAIKNSEKSSSSKDSISLYENLLTRGPLELFTVKELLNLQENQKQVLDHWADVMEIERLKRIRTLIGEYPEYSDRIFLSQAILSNFSNQELNEMSEEDARMYQKADRMDLVNRVKQVKKINPEFKCVNNFIITGAFDQLTDQEIAELSEGTQERIVNYYCSQIRRDTAEYEEGLAKLIKREKQKQHVKKIVQKITSII